MEKLASIAKAVFPEPGATKVRKIVRLTRSPFGNRNKHMESDVLVQQGGRTPRLCPAGLMRELQPQLRSKQNGVFFRNESAKIRYGTPPNSDIRFYISSPYPPFSQSSSLEYQ